MLRRFHAKANLPATHVDEQDGRRHDTLLRLRSACSRARCRAATARRRTTTAIAAVLGTRCSSSSSSTSTCAQAPVLTSPDEPLPLSQVHCRSPRATSQRPLLAGISPPAHRPPRRSLADSATYSPPRCSGGAVGASTTSSCPATGSRHMRHARAAVSVFLVPTRPQPSQRDATCAGSTWRESSGAIKAPLSPCLARRFAIITRSLIPSPPRSTMDAAADLLRYNRLPIRSRLPHSDPHPGLPLRSVPYITIGIQ